MPPVLSITIPPRRESTLMVCALKHGIGASAIDRDPADSVLYVDLVGSTEKMLLVADKVDATIIEENDRVRRGLDD